ncbi:MAG: uncharacterized protein JWO56_1101 [Acidobacteria bacterium]|nr:uncharacterized protein [Acidobacteriota bacterium]
MRLLLRTAPLFLLIASTAFASQPLETETARIMPAGTFKIEAAAEFQTSKEGTERAFPLVFEYAFTDRTELTVEPVFGTSIRPKHAPSASGAGDIEVTLTHLFLPESGSLPAFAGAGEVKLPTAKNRLIGTGKTDFTAWAIASKRLGALDLHANLGYTVVGKPSGTNLHNIVDYAIAEEYHVSPQVDVVGELLGNTSATGEGAEGSTSGGVGLPAEAAGAEKSVMIGMRYKYTPKLAFSIGVSYDNNHALLIRPGITWRFGGK